MTCILVHVSALPIVPIVTLAELSKLSPSIVMVLPPTCGPVFGVIDIIEGGRGLATAVNIRVLVYLPAGIVVSALAPIVMVVGEEGLAVDVELRRVSLPKGGIARKVVCPEPWLKPQVLVDRVLAVELVVELRTSEVLVWTRLVLREEEDMDSL